jgi:hypothetical protein
VIRGYVILKGGQVHTTIADLPNDPEGRRVIAHRRAEVIARANPGQEVFVAEVYAVAVAPVPEVKFTLLDSRA